MKSCLNHLGTEVSLTYPLKAISSVPEIVDTSECPLCKREREEEKKRAEIRRRISLLSESKHS